MSGLYIHIPFCHAKCAYCDFFSTPRRDSAVEFVEALIREFHHRRAPYGTFSTIYLGGGTPSSIPLSLLDRIFASIPTHEASEITIEVNPEDVTPEFARWLAESPVNRISIGVQSLTDAELQFIGRRHSAREAINAVETLRHAGISNLSLDLIYGLPFQDLYSWQTTLDKILALTPEHLSAYALMLEPGTRLCAMKQAGRFSETPDDTIAAMYKILCRRASERGYEHYEISNFALPGRASKHNSSYWNLTPYLGLGPGAHSFDGRNRYYNPGQLKEYITSPETFTLIEEESTTERINDYIMIRLRTAAGLDLVTFRQLFGNTATEQLRRSAHRHIDAGRLINPTERLHIPEHLFLISDSIISDLMFD